MHLLGEFSLNISLILYIIFYLPQLWHNRNRKKLNQLSIYFHALLLLAASTDLLYGFGTIGQWQYKMVSLTTFACVMWQHGQLLRHHKYNLEIKKQLNYATGALIIWWLVVIFMIVGKEAQHPFFVAMGWVERLAYSCYGIPQIIKQIRSQRAEAISTLFLYLSITTAACDTVSAWAFGWPAPSLFGAPLACLIHLVLLWQIYRRKNSVDSSLLAA